MDDNNPDPKPEENLTQKQMEELLARVGYIEKVLRDQLSRLYEIELRLGLTPQSFKPPARSDAPRRAPAMRPEIPASDQLRAREPLKSPPAGEMPGLGPENSVSLPPPQSPPAGYQSPFTPTAPPINQARPFDQRAQPTNQPLPPPGTLPRPGTRSAPRKPSDLETKIGGVLFKFVGVIAMIFGTAFLLKIGFDYGYVTPTVLVMIVAVAGIAILGLGEKLRKNYPSYAYALSGLGISLLYLSVWGAFNRYHLISQPLAMMFMSLVTTTAALLSARYNALAIAILGLVGGFLTPILLSTDVDNEIGLFSYIALLDAGVLALAFTKQWRVLNYLAFIGTMLMVTAWYIDRYEPAKLTPTIFFLTLFFIIFAMLAILYNVLNRRPTRWLDLAMVFSNAVLYFGSSYGLLNDSAQSGSYHAYLGAFAVLMAAFYGLLGYFTFRRDREDRLLVLTFGGLTFLFLVLAVPIQFNQQWVTMAWAVEGAVMTWVGLRAKDKTSLYAALCLFGIAAFHWFIVDVPTFAYEEGKTFTPFFNPRAYSCAVLVAAFAAAAQLFKRFGAHLANEERSLFNGIYLLGANAFAITLLSLDISSYFEYKRALMGGTDEVRETKHTQLFTLTALWAMYGAVMLFIGVIHKLRVLRVTALILMAITALTVSAEGLAFYKEPGHTAFFNQTFASFLCVVAVLALGAWWYSRSEEVGPSERSALVPLLVAAANLLTLMALSIEVIGHYDRLQNQTSGEGATLENAKQFVLSALWSLYAAVSLAVGVKRRSRLLRLGALALLVLTTLKLLFIDLSFYNSPSHYFLFNYTFGAFLCVIATLAAGIWLYGKLESVDNQERISVIPVMIVAANVLALIALSTEAWGYFDKQFAQELAREAQQNLRLKQQLSISVIWTVYGGVLLSLGIARRSLLLRVMALLLLGVTIVKVFFLDLSSLDKLYRTVSFFVLGAILLAVSFLYQKFRGRFFDTATEDK